MKSCCKYFLQSNHHPPATQSTHAHGWLEAAPCRRASKDCVEMAEKEQTQGWLTEIWGPACSLALPLPSARQPLFLDLSFSYRKMSFLEVMTSEFPSSSALPFYGSHWVALHWLTSDKNVICIKHCLSDWEQESCVLKNNGKCGCSAICRFILALSL